MFEMQQLRLQPSANELANICTNLYPRIDLDKVSEICIWFYIHVAICTRNTEEMVWISALGQSFVEQPF